MSAAVAVEDEHHESDVDEDAALSNDATAAPVAAARAPAFHEDDTGSEVRTGQYPVTRLADFLM